MLNGRDNVSKKVMKRNKPNDILHELMQHPTIASDPLLLDHLEQAKNLLPALSKSQYESGVPNELAGTIAVLIGTACSNHCDTPIGTVCSNHCDTPIVMVTSATDRQPYTLMLRKVVDALRQLDFLPHGYGVTEKCATNSYFCRKRFENACANGASYPNTFSELLTVEQLDAPDAKKLCVQSCSKSCKHHASCKYQLLRAQMRAGDAKLQVYTEQQYCSALNANRLPKARMTLYSPQGKRLIAPCPQVLREAEFKKLLAWCEKDGSKLQRHKKLVNKKVAAVREHVSLLFSMPPNEGDEAAARQHLAAIVCNLQEMRSACIKTSKSPEKSSLLRALEKTIAKGTAMLQQDLSITHKNQLTCNTKARPQPKDTAASKHGGCYFLTLF